MNALAKEVKYGGGPSASPLTVAMGRGNLPVIKELIALGADADNCEPYPYDKRGPSNSPIKRWIQQGFKKEVLAALIEAGADVDGVVGMPPLHFAISHGSLEAVRALCDAGANLALKCRMGSDPALPFETPLAFAIHNQFASSPIEAELRARGAPLA